MVRDSSENLNFFDGLVNNFSLFNRTLTAKDELDIIDFIDNLKEADSIGCRMFGKVKKKFVSFLISNLDNIGHEEAMAAVALLSLLDTNLFNVITTIKADGSYKHISNEYTAVDISNEDYEDFKKDITGYKYYMTHLSQNFIENKLHDNILPCNSLTLVIMTVKASL